MDQDPTPLYWATRAIAKLQACWQRKERSSEERRTGGTQREEGRRTEGGRTEGGGKEDGVQCRIQDFS